MIKQALVGMSGGVDSSVAAYLVREAGYDTTGATMRLFDNETIGLDSGKTCCSLSSIEDACAVANRLGISYVVYDMREDFKREVINRFVDAYEHGATPNPCVACNKHLKFDLLYQLCARDLLSDQPDAGNLLSNAASNDDSGTYTTNSDGSSDSKSVVLNSGVNNAGNANTGKSADSNGYTAVRSLAEAPPLSIATGHYARIEHDRGAGRFLLRKGVDPGKDQSYFLCDLTQEQLGRTLFPLGSMTKSEVRDVAESLGLVTAKKRESQDICFVPGGDYASFIKGYTGHEYPYGDFVDAHGNVMGEHKGIIKYTIGQRKGLGLALKKPAYVCALDVENNRAILGDNGDLFKRDMTASEFNWIAMDVPSSDIRASARIRYRHHEAPARIIPLGADRVKIEFDEPQRAMTRGQSVVVYDGEYVIGGGIID